MGLYLSSYDYLDFFSPREISIINKFSIEGRSILMVNVSPTINGLRYGVASQEISKIFLVNRVNENSFDKMTHFPIDVHVLISSIDLKTIPNSLKDMLNIAWASLYDDLEDARRHDIT